MFEGSIVSLGHEFKPYSEVRGDGAGEWEWISAGGVEIVVDASQIENRAGKAAKQLHDWWSQQRKGNELPVQLEVEHVYKTDQAGTAANFEHAELRLMPTRYQEDKLHLDQFKQLVTDFKGFKQRADSIRIRPR